MCPSGLPLSYGQETESTYTFYYKEMLLCTVEFHLVNDLELLDRVYFNQIEVCLYDESLT